jgi:hypothetical protein
MILTLRQKLSKDWTKRFMTDTFKNMEQLENYMVQHLYSLYDQIGENDWDNLENDYIQGSIDTTQHYLLKSGVEFLDESAYIEKVESQKWVKA